MRSGRPIGVRLPVDLGGRQALQGTIGALLFAANAYTPPAKLTPDDITAAGKTAYYVSATGNNASAGTSPATAWQTVTKVNASAFNPGDGVFFEAGSTFSDAILSPPSNGSSGSPVLFGTYGTAGQGILSLGVTVPAGRAYVTLDNLRTKNVLGASGGGAKTKIRAQNCVIGGFSTEYGHECASTTDTGWEFVACEISDTRDSGIITWADGTLVEGCRIHDVGTQWDTAAYNYGLHGIYSKSPNIVVRSNEIWNVLDPDGQCVTTRYRGALIEGNYFHDSFEGVGFYNDDATAPGSSRTTIVRYNLMDRVQNGVLVDANGNTVAGMPENWRIYNNTIRTSLKANAGSTYSTPIRYYNNGASSNKGTELILKNNILVVGAGVSNYAIIDVKDSPTLTTYQETNNLLYVTSFSFYAERNGSGASSLAAWQTLTSQGTSDLAVDPLLDANLQPAPTSVVINAGTTSVSGATFVVAANNNPLSYSESAPDMGAFEFVVATSDVNISVTPASGTAGAATHASTFLIASTNAVATASAASPAPTLANTYTAALATANALASTTTQTVSTSAGTSALATASGAAPSPRIQQTYTAALATASAGTHATTATQAASVTPASATANAAAPSPRIAVASTNALATASAPSIAAQSITTTPAGATANAPTATPTFLVASTPATATANAGTHSSSQSTSAATSPASATAGAPATATTFLLSTTNGSATAGAAGSTTTISVAATPGSSTADAPAPAPLFLVATPSATATASAPNPSFSLAGTLSISATPGTATASGPTASVTFLVAGTPASASASAAGSSPAFGVSSTVGDATASAPAPSFSLSSGLFVSTSPATATASSAGATVTLTTSTTPGTATASGPAPAPASSTAVTSCSAAASGTSSAPVFFTLATPASALASAPDAGVTLEGAPLSISTTPATATASAGPVTFVIGLFPPQTTPLVFASSATGLSSSLTTGSFAATPASSGAFGFDPDQASFDDSEAVLV